MPVTNTGTESNGISAHGTLIYKGGQLIAELRDITPPSLSRRVYEVTRQSDEDERNKVGIRVYGDLGFQINLLLTDPTHLDLIDAWVNALVDQYVITFPDGTEWTFDGYVIDISADAPVDGAQRADVKVRPTGGIALAPLLITEAGEDFETESGELLTL